MLINLTPIENKLLTNGFDALSMQDKNNLVTVIANKENKMYYEITEEYILEYHKKIKTDILSDTCDETIVNGFKSTNGHHYRTNRDDQLNMLGKMLQLMNDPTITTINWKTEDVGYVSHTKDEWIQKVFNEGLSHKETTLFKYNTLKGQVQSATTDAEVLAVAWN